MSMGLNVTVSVMALLALLIMVNYLASRHFRRMQVTSSSRFPLSPLTVRLLDSVTNKLKVVVFFDPRNPMHSSVKRLINEYEAECSKMEVEYVDYVLSPARAEQVRADYKLAWGGDGDRIIFDSNGKTKVVYAKDLSEYDYDKILQGEEVKRTGFKGEQLFTSAIYGVIDPKPLKVYFLQGHREHDPTSQTDLEGYLSFAQIMQENNIVVDRLSSLSFDDVPADCHLLIAARPLNRLEPVELENIEKYLNQGGRLMVLFSHQNLNVQTGLERLLMDWGVVIGRSRVVDLSQAKADGGQKMIVSAFSDHSIVKSLRGSRLSLVLPRSVSQQTAVPQSADAAKVVELAFTSPKGSAIRADGKSERAGSIPLMVCVEKGNIPGFRADRGATRLVVVGESLFMGNTLIDEGANRDLARNAVNWLLNRDVLLEEIGPHPIKEYKIIMTESELKTMRRLFLAGFPGTVLLVGFLVWLRRRS
jgi:hypothetical protein